MKADSVKVIVQFSKALLARTDQTATGLGVSRASLIRTAVAEKVQRHEKERMDQELRKGYIEMEEFRLRDHKAFRNA